MRTDRKEHNCNEGHEWEHANHDFDRTYIGLGCYFGHRFTRGFRLLNRSTSRTFSRHGSPPGKCWAKPNTFSVRGTSQTWSRHSGSILRHAFFLYKLLVTIEYTSSNLAAVKIVRSSTFSTFWIVCRPRQRRAPFQAELREYDEDNRG